MNQKEARKLLGISVEDDLKSIKLKYRKMMHRYHPDAVESAGAQEVKIAQEINEAYQLVVSSLPRKTGRTEREIWNAEQNPFAFCERNIYTPYHIDLCHFDERDARTVSKMYQTAARGRYYWNPEEEEFRYFIKSIHHAGKELLFMVEREVEGYEDSSLEDELSKGSLPYQIRLFHYLGLQFIKPKECLLKLANPEYMDKRNRPIYRFSTYIGAKKGELPYKNMQSLHKGDVVYPELIRNNRLFVVTDSRNTLGALSMENDALYFCIMPLLKAKKVSVKMTVDDVSNGNQKISIQAKISLFLRFEDDSDYVNENYTEEIQELLKQYKAYCEECL